MYLSCIDNDSMGYFGYIAECDTDAVGGTVGEEHITARYRRKRGGIDRMRELAHLVGWGVDWSRTEDNT